MKIAASFNDERDAAKTFGKAWLTGHAGTIAGTIAGAAALGSLATRHKAFGTKLQGIGKSITGIKEKYGEKPIGKAVSKVFGTKTGPAAAGAVVGGIVGGDIGDYAAIRHGVLQSKRNAKQNQ